MSTDARQNTTQSIARPYWNAHSTVSGASGMPTPTATTRSASSAEKRAVSVRFIPVGAYRRGRAESPRRTGRGEMTQQSGSDFGTVPAVR